MLFPNPANNYVQINTEARINQVVICDITGKQMLIDETGLSKVNISTLNAGVYFVQVNIKDQEAKIFKLIKN